MIKFLSSVNNSMCCVGPQFEGIYSQFQYNGQNNPNIDELHSTRYILQRYSFRTDKIKLCIVSLVDSYIWVCNSSSNYYRFDIRIKEMRLLPQIFHVDLFLFFHADRKRK